MQKSIIKNHIEEAHKEAFSKHKMASGYATEAFKRVHEHFDTDSPEHSHLKSIVTSEKWIKENMNSLFGKNWKECKARFFELHDVFQVFLLSFLANLKH